MAFLVAATALACTTEPSPVAPSTTGLASPTEPPVVATATEGPFHLRFELPRATWQADEAITGTASLTLTGLDHGELGGSGGSLVVYDYLELGGTRHVEPAQTADCARHPISSVAPIVEPLAKSGGYGSSDPDADFIRAFLTGPDVRLPPGEWRITAIANFNDQGDCSGRNLMIEAPLTITVVP